MKKVYKLFGRIPVWAVDFDGFEDEMFIPGAGGSFELAPEPVEYEDDEEYYEDVAFGFRGPT